ncbi:LLM class flavin-dependent oxidoreductase [Rhodococcus opacus]|uniref:Putative oxidoreductase n=1 Tax=Rhodococcus opacus (strain B4) TaxID=632772 RepID=C1B620_RHOOB|nr:LLM class flavin-dependent oxidoreductase [Rhodococcus opacus]BAH55431.1 putative oxidoreductase [Rhodococcus opacus B4]
MTADVRHRMGDLQFGVYVPQFKMDVTSVLATATVVEECGFDSFWLMDHLYAPGAPPCDMFESWTLLTAVAAVTSRIRLGHLVGCNPFRHPALLAKMAATLDQISGGRLDLGLGWGSVEAELTAFGFPLGSKRERSEALGETLEILELMFTGEPFDYEGRQFQLHSAFGLPRPVHGRIPIHIGGGGPTLTMPLVARYADWWNCVGGARNRLDELSELKGRARISAQYAVGMAADESDVEHVAALTARRMPIPAWGAALVGTTAQLVEQFQREHERGVELFVLRFHDFAAADTLRRFAGEVLEPLKAWVEA